MCRVQSPRLAAVEALGQVMRIPQVEVPDLRALDADNAEERSGRHLECLGLPGWYGELGDFGQLSARPVIKRGVERWQMLDRICQHRGCAAPRCRVRGWRRMHRLRHALTYSKKRQESPDTASILRLDYPLRFASLTRPRLPECARRDRPDGAVNGGH